MTVKNSRDQDGTAASSPAPSRKLDVSTLGEAVGYFNMSLTETSIEVEICSSKFPQRKLHLQAALLDWMARHSVELYATVANQSDGPEIETLKSALDARVRSQFDAAIATRGESVCSGLIDDLSSSRRDVAQDAPTASRLLREFANTHPLPDADADHQEFVFGCTRRNLNEAEEYIETMRRCGCVGQAVLPALPAERRHALARDSSLQSFDKLLEELSMDAAVADGVRSCSRSQQNTQ
jgi:hypothetical protein